MLCMLENIFRYEKLTQIKAENIYHNIEVLKMIQKFTKILVYRIHNHRDPY